MLPAATLDDDRVAVVIAASADPASTSMAGSGDVMRHASTRLTAGFAYVGPPLPRLVARALLDA